MFALPATNRVRVDFGDCDANRIICIVVLKQRCVKQRAQVVLVGRIVFKDGARFHRNGRVNAGNVVDACNGDVHRFWAAVRFAVISDDDNRASRCVGFVGNVVVRDGL